MTLEQVAFNTFGGVNRGYKVVKCSNVFFIDRFIWEQYANKELYISWSGAKKSDYESSWKEFLDKWKIKEEIEFLEFKFSNQKQ